MTGGIPGTDAAASIFADKFPASRPADCRPPFTSEVNDAAEERYTVGSIAKFNRPGNAEELDVDGSPVA